MTEYLVGMDDIHRLVSNKATGSNTVVNITEVVSLVHESLLFVTRYIVTE